MEKNRRKIINKIRRFYERERKAKWFKVTNEVIKDLSLMQIIIENQVKYSERHPTWCRNHVVQIGYDGLDFMEMKKTVRIDYTYPKYGNM